MSSLQPKEVDPPVRAAYVTSAAGKALASRPVILLIAN
jgi:hypothetical protein